MANGRYKLQARKTDRAGEVKPFALSLENKSFNV